MYMQLVLVFYHCVTNYQNLSSFKYLPIIISQFYRVEVWVTHVWVLLMFHKAETEVLATLLYFLEYLRMTTIGNW